MLRPLPGEMRLWRAVLQRWAWRFAYWELLQSPRLNPRQRIGALVGISGLVVGSWIGWWVPRLVRWLVTGQGSFRPSRHTSWPNPQLGLPPRLAADMETARREAEESGHTCQLPERRETH